MIRILGILVLAAIAARAQQAQPEPAPFDRFGRFVGLTADIDKLTLQLTELRKRYSDTHPEVRALRERLDGLRAQLTAERDRAFQGEASRVAAESTLARMQAELARAQSLSGTSGRLVDNWWRNTNIVNTLRLTPMQVKQMEETFQQHRLRLIDLNAALEKEEVTLEPLVSADTLDEGKLTAQIDRVAQARAELEKSRGRMLVGIRKVLEPEQWRKLNDMGFSVTSR